MDKILFLLIHLLFMLAICFIQKKSSVITPQFGFIACFIPAIAYSISYIDLWNLDLSHGTVFVLFIGPILFFIVSMIVQFFYDNSLTKRNRITIYDSNQKFTVKNLCVENWKLIILLIFQLFILFWVISELQKMSGKTLSENIMTYRVRDDDAASFPTILDNLRKVCIYSSYVTIYILILGIITKVHRGRILLICNIVLSAMISVTSGARTMIFAMFVSAFVQFYILNRQTSYKRKKLPIKYVFIGLTITVLLIVSFQTLGNYLGRGNELNYSEYIAIYLSAEIKNLDIFIRSGNFGADISRSQTMHHVVNIIARVFNISSLHSEGLDNPFNYINGHSLGNVGTVYYAFLYDGGYIGLFIFTILMAILSQIAYQRAIVKRNQSINVNIIVYSYIFFAIIFSFFSDKFYEFVFSMDFVKLLLTCWALKYFINNVKFTKKVYK